MLCTAIWGIALGPRKKRNYDCIRQILGNDEAVRESTYTLINHYNISSGTIDRIRKGQGITTAKLDDFCQIFHCRVEDLITYVEPADGEPHSPYSEKPQNKATV